MGEPTFQEFQIDDVKKTCGLANSEIFGVPATCEDVVDSTYIEAPISSSALSDSGDQPLEFSYKGIPNIYIDLKRSHVVLDLKLEHSDGTPLEDEEDVGPVNFLGKKTHLSLFLITSSVVFNELSFNF